MLVIIRLFMCLVWKLRPNCDQLKRTRSSIGEGHRFDVLFLKNGIEVEMA